MKEFRLSKADHRTQWRNMSLTLNEENIQEGLSHTAVKVKSSLRTDYTSGCEILSLLEPETQTRAL